MVRRDVEPGRLVLEGVQFFLPGPPSAGAGCGEPTPAARANPGVGGATGTGKSTVLRLILRQYAQSTGAIRSIHDDILRMPQGYDTPVGEKGIALSGGQRQRVAIARAMLTDAPLLLLDDALSAVDTQTETDILHHLRSARAGRTALIVSHRLSAVMDADHIVVLKHGRISEQGDHASLLARNGWYAAQWRYQQLEASLDAA
ncbi:ATP-binding cassette domain-containing protein [Candidatus Aalborgicola defluviihabitans]|uniref:ATP-binding cassette domain-containing protein n=1 Tax=Candidatus Aalborgicola defluviihabitans TaxID=3386187 RepID=UPI0039B95A9E